MTMLACFVLILFIISVEYYKKYTTKYFNENKHIMTKKSIAKTKDDSKFEIIEKRKLHDMWALILYIICFSILLSLSIFFAQRNSKNKKTTFELVDSDFFPTADKVIISRANNKTHVYRVKICEFFIGDFLKIILAPISIFIIMLILAYIFTTVFLHSAIVSQIILTTFSAGNSVANNHPIKNILKSIILTIFLSLFYACIFKRIKFSSKPFKMAIRIMWSCLSLFTSLILFYALISVGIAYVFQTPHIQGFSKVECLIIGFFWLLLTLWTLFLILMISQVAMSAITSQYLIHDLTGLRLVGSSLKIVFYSLGSACFAALMLAIISIIRKLVEGETENQDSERGRTLPMSIFLTVLHIIISLFEDFAHFFTSWAMTVIALKGCKLTTAMKSVLFDIRTGFLSSLITGKLMGMLVFAAIFAEYFIFKYGIRVRYLKEVIPNSRLDKYLKPLMSETEGAKYTQIGSKNYIGVLNPIPKFYLIVVFMCLAGFGMLIQKIMEMIYLIFNENPDVIKRKDIEVYESMEAELNFKGGYCGC